MDDYNVNIGAPVTGSNQKASDAPSAEPRARYHHGSLKAAMLAAGEDILEREGVQGLTLRAAARLAGASHAAPKNHFGDLTGLLSELAAVGFLRFRDAMLAEAAPDMPLAQKRQAIGLGYVKFAIHNPGLFLLMFRSEKLDMERPALKSAAQAAFAVLSGSSPRSASNDEPTTTLKDMAEMVAAWSKVHGLAMLLIDGRLRPVTSSLPKHLSEEDFIRAVLAGPSRS